ncbi:MAG TPA: NADH-quinone oxidoreductase subunit N [Luteibaculaceae bacterium]|nr:NADH-quinone oxidoreductase subunit N [Luteibaculaceae bacterium]
MNAIIILSLLGIGILFAGIFNLKNRSIVIALLGIAAAVYANTLEWGNAVSYYNDMVKIDNYTLAFSTLMAITTGLVLLMGYQHYPKAENNAVDLYGLMLFTLVGAICLVSFNHLAVLFIGIEILSIPLYILAGSNRSQLESNEAGMKYFLMGSFTSGFLLMGIALIYITTGSFHLAEIGQAIAQEQISSSPLLIAGILMVLGGFLFKIAAVPFHFWAPDVYEGSPTIATALMSTVVKTAAFAAMFKLFQSTLAPLEGIWYDALWIITALTLLASNITALYQNGIKRLLAYSSVSHAGYMLLAVLTLNQKAADAILFYSISYSLSSVLAFSLIIAASGSASNIQFDALKGLGRKRPFMGFALSIALLSLAGIPPLSGFMAKFYLFKTALEVNLFWIIIIAIVGSIVGAYYYVRVIATLYQHTSNENSEKLSPATWALAIIALAAVLIGGLYPTLFMNIL